MPARYDAFISYSHARDQKLAQSLQTELQRFARPWYRARALRVFRDTTSLAATPELWPTIERALSDSDWLILMASPQSAGSPWVTREVRWWVAHRPPDRLLIALSGGSIAWDTATGDFDWAATDALSEELSGILRNEPLWVDLRNVQRTDVEGRPRLGDVVAEFAAPIRGVDKDTLVGEHVVQEKRTKRILRGVVATLAVLLLAVSVATVFAVRQRNEAVSQSRIATARQLAATAISLTSSRMDLAQLFAVEADRMHADQQTRAALFQVVTASPALVRYLPAGAPVTTLAGSGDGRYVVAGTSTGRVLRWPVAGGPPATVAQLDGAVTSVATDAHGSTVVAGTRSAVVRWTATGVRPLPPSGRSTGVVAVSPSGRLVAWATGPRAGEDPTQVVLQDTAGGHTTRRDLDFGPVRMEFAGESELVAVAGDGVWDRMTAPALTSTVHSDDSLGGVHGFEATLSTGGGWFTFSNSGGDLAIWNTAKRADQRSPDLEALSHGSEEQALAVSADGTRTASADAGTIYVSRSGPGTPPSDAQLVLSGGGAVPSGGLRFLGDDLHLVSATGNALVLWDLGQLTRIGAGSRVNVPVTCIGCAAPQLAVVADGARLAIGNSDGRAVSVVDTTTGRSRTVLENDVTRSLNLVGWSADGRTVTTEHDRNLETRDGTDPARIVGTAPLGADGVLALSADRKQAVVEHDNQIAVEDTATGRTTRTVARFPPTASILEIWAGAEGRVVAALVTVDGHNRVYVIEDGRMTVLPGPDAREVTLAGDDLLVQRTSGVLERWRVGAGHPYWTIQQDASFMPEGIYTRSHPVAGGSMVAQRRSDGAIVLTDAATGQQLGAVDLPPGSALDKTSLAFLPDGSDLVSVTEGDRNGLFVRWSLAPGEWIATACRTAARDVTADEWTQYVGTAARPDHICDAAGTAPAAPRPAVGVAATTPPATTPPATTPAVTAPQPLATDMEGRNPAYLTRVDPVGHTVTVDRIEITDGAVVNNNPKLRTLQVGDTVPVTTTQGAVRATAAIPVGTLADFLGHHPAAAPGRLSSAPYQLAVSHGRVLSLEQLSPAR